MKAFRLLTMAVLVAATVPRLAHRGMFVDGVTYASIARNLAEGRGGFWTPTYTATVYPQFHEHPPLGFWLQSLWFRVLGDHLIVERAYSLTVALATAWILLVLWRRIDVDRQTQGMESSDGDPERVDRLRQEWVPILLWIAVPVVSWAVVGNLLETTVALFTTTAIAAVVAAFSAGSIAENANSTEGSSLIPIGWGMVSGVCIVAAGLTKGPVGVFPLVAPFALLLGTRGRPVMRVVLGQWGVCAIGSAILFFTPEARASLTAYLEQQVFAALTGQREVSAHSMVILRALLQGVVLPMAGVMLLAIIGAGRFVAPSRMRHARALGFLLLGLAGTLPILASAKQAGHYLVPAVPAYAVAAALLMAPTIALLVQRVQARRWDRCLNVASVLILFTAVGMAYAPGVGRDRARLGELDRIASRVPRAATIGICADANGDWGLHAWFERRFQVSLDARNVPPHEWFLQTAPVAGGCPPSACTAAAGENPGLVLMTCPPAK